MKLVYASDSKSVLWVGGWWRVSIADPLRVKQMLSHEVDRVCEEREGFEPSVRSICCGVRVRVSPSACLSQTDSWCCPTTNFFLSRNDPPHTLLPKQARNGVVYECCLQAWHQQLFFESQCPPMNYGLEGRCLLASRRGFEPQWLEWAQWAEFFTLLRPINKLSKHVMFFINQQCSELSPPCPLSPSSSTM